MELNLFDLNIVGFDPKTIFEFCGTSSGEKEKFLNFETIFEEILKMISRTENAENRENLNDLGEASPHESTALFEEMYGVEPFLCTKVENQTDENHLSFGNEYECMLEPKNGECKEKEKGDEFSFLPERAQSVAHFSFPIIEHFYAQLSCDRAENASKKTEEEVFHTLSPFLSQSTESIRTSRIFISHPEIVRDQRRDNPCHDSYFSNEIKTKDPQLIFVRYVDKYSEVYRDSSFLISDNVDQKSNYSLKTSLAWNIDETKFDFTKDREVIPILWDRMEHSPPYKEQKGEVFSWDTRDTKNVVDDEILPPRSEKFLSFFPESETAKEEKVEGLKKEIQKIHMESDNFLFESKERLNSYPIAKEIHEPLSREVHKTFSTSILDRIQKVIEAQHGYAKTMQMGLQMSFRMELDNGESVRLTLKDIGPKMVVEVKTGNEIIANLIDTGRYEIIRTLEEKNVPVDIYVYSEPKDNERRQQKEKLKKQERTDEIEDFEDTIRSIT
ncbi:MAG: hypothetical protein N2513_01765 [Deltaproteobacteria bacterium]|nr:hypothetical protein [Deltaproteobacteria bacterium]